MAFAGIPMRRHPRSLPHVAIPASGHRGLDAQYGGARDRADQEGGGSAAVLEPSGPLPQSRRVDDDRTALPPRGPASASCLSPTPSSAVRSGPAASTNPS
ncbi:hypothetical protein SNE510_57740 [Streptomyces sp. NE5-10]|nr:hypothetical protein SNE510_57740 [Streptomyces sp. NE5-10]